VLAFTTIAALPTLVVDVAAAAVAITVIGTAIGAVFRWIINPFFIKPFVEWFHETKVRPELADIGSNLEEVKHLIVYHLGGNGTTVAVRDRLLLLEEDVKGNKQMGVSVQTTLGSLTEKINQLSVEKEVRENDNPRL